MNTYLVSEWKHRRDIDNYIVATMTKAWIVKAYSPFDAIDKVSWGSITLWDKRISDDHAYVQSEICRYCEYDSYESQLINLDQDIIEVYEC